MIFSSDFADLPRAPRPIFRRVALSDPLLFAAEKLAQARHRLAHYRPQDASRKLYYQPPPPVKLSDGTYYREIWSAEMMPERIEPSFVELELLGDKPKEHFLAAWNVFRQWEVSNGGDGSRLAAFVPSL